MNPVKAIGPGPNNSNDINYQADWNRYVQEQLGPAMETYYQRFTARLSELGYRVTVVESTSATGFYAVTPYWSGTMERNGITAGWTLLLHQAETAEPEALAEYYSNFVWAFAPGAGATTITTPTAPVTPDAPPTIPGGNTQVVQTPATPDSGTLTTPPTTPPTEERASFDVWNWYYNLESGREGPAPETVGGDRAVDYTKAQWWALVQPWLAGSGGTTGGGGGAGSGVPDPGAGGGAGGGVPDPGPGGGGGGGGVVTPPSGMSDNEKLMLGAVVVVLVLLLTR